MNYEEDYARILFKVKYTTATQIYELCAKLDLKKFWWEYFKRSWNEARIKKIPISTSS